MVTGPAPFSAGDVVRVKPESDMFRSHAGERVAVIRCKPYRDRHTWRLQFRWANNAHPTNAAANFFELAEAERADGEDSSLD